jgi:hypothetical protein
MESDSQGTIDITKAGNAMIHYTMVVHSILPYPLVSDGSAEECSPRTKAKPPNICLGFLNIHQINAQRTQGILYKSLVNARLCSADQKEFCTNRLTSKVSAQKTKWNLYKSLGNERSMLRRPVNSVQITWCTVGRSQSNNWDCLMGLPKPITQGTTQ